MVSDYYEKGQNFLLLLLLSILPRSAKFWKHAIINTSIYRRKHKESRKDDEFHCTPEQRAHKMQRVGEGSMNNRRPSSERQPKRRGEYEVEDVHLGNLAVGEAWPEKRNIVLVGSEETSIPLFCQGWCCQKENGLLYS